MEFCLQEMSETSILLELEEPVRRRLPVAAAVYDGAMDAFPRP